MCIRASYIEGTYILKYESFAYINALTFIYSLLNIFKKKKKENSY